MDKPFAIKFGDNDYGKTFVPLMRALVTCDFQGTKDDLIALINETIYSFYAIHQAGGVVNETPTKYGTTRSYLKVGHREVYFGQDEVDGFFKDPAKMGTVDHDLYYWYPGQSEPQVM